MLKASIIIPNWNGEQKLLNNLPEVLKIAKEEGIDEVIVVDDASTDNSVEILKTRFPEVKLVEKSKNSGFSSTVNLGVQHATGELVIQLNSDARPKRRFLTEALPHFKDPKVFSVNCNVGGVWNRADWRDGYFWHHQADEERVDRSKSHTTLWSSGGSGIFRKKLWDQMGGLDELFNPFYEEDLDLGYRATKRGYINIWEPKSQVDHYKEKGVIAANFSKQKIAATAQRNQLLFIWKNISSEKMMREHNLALTKMLLSHPKYWLIFLAALKRWPALKQKRQLELQAAKLRDEEVLALFS